MGTTGVHTAESEMCPLKKNPEIAKNVSFTFLYLYSYIFIFTIYRLIWCYSVLSYSVVLKIYFQKYYRLCKPYP